MVSAYLAGMPPSSPEEVKVMRILPYYGRIVCVVCAILILSGCSTSGGSSSSQTGRQDRNLITKADLEGMGDLNAYEAIRRLKPMCLR